jgi:hypothetical protein
MKKLFHISIASLILTACGSDGPNFGPETEPTPAQQTVINSTAQHLGTLAMADVEGEAAGAAALEFAFDAQALIDTGSSARQVPRLPGAAQLAPTAMPVPDLAQLLDCPVVGSNSIVWNHCTDNNGTTIDGMISWSPGHVDVDLHIAASSQGLQATYSLVGSMTVSAAAIQADMTIMLSYSGNGVNFTETVHTQIDVQITNGCVSSGTLTVTASGSGAGSRSGAVQIVWSGCNAFRVRRG